MRPRPSLLPFSILLCWCAFALPGCGWWHAQTEDDIEEDLADDGDGHRPGAPVQKAPPIPEHKLELNLKVGDRFPLLKRVEHALKQPAEQGWLTSRSTLEMLLTVTVEEIGQAEPQSAEPGAPERHNRLQVKYHRVKFTQDLPGQPRVEYDSESPSYPVPIAALGYHGLKDNSFELWLSRDNQIIEMKGFDEFIGRCLKEVPPARQQQVRANMAATSGADGIANFVDDSIGLLPSSAVREGESWTIDRQVVQPVPMYISTKYTLHQVSGDIAEIGILGAISPSVTYGPSKQPNSEFNVSIRGGQSIGTCLIDRRTGLPVQSRVEQALTMNVRMADGSEFEQHKSTLTTIRCFPEQGSARTIANDTAPSQDAAPGPRGASGVRQAEHQTEPRRR